MQKMIRSLALVALVTLNGSAFGGVWLDRYFPLCDGDQTTFIYDTTNVLTLSISALGADQFEICVDSDAISECLIVERNQDGCFLLEAKVGYNTVSVDPPVLLLNDNLLQNGGTVKTDTTATQSGIDPYPATFTVT